MPLTAPLSHVAIIGGGLAVRNSPFQPGALHLLSPNALRVLDTVHVLERVKKLSFHIDVLAFKDDHDKTTDEYYFGSETLYGYSAIRTMRKLLLDEMKIMLRERNIPIHFDHRLIAITDGPDQVEFTFENGLTASAPLLIGADGIHSSVRKTSCLSLATLLSKLSDKATLDKAVVKWQTYRQERINKVLELIKQMNAKRLPEAERVKLPPGAIWVDQSLTRGDGGELRWLYEPDLVTDAATWVQELENDA
ncbi:hypothetical protein DM02DRAFT_664116 [Periconia macrospinosa]|uniref:FAD-binding domain-containing protein n=1 Tax=Periconia macrospinosa TaxID=97972 RepID=A0A2V1CZZ7_9PLEO|nr:hypothetical protein DM02DRAFT_664116 [Periconia macrospinosa]